MSATRDAKPSGSRASGGRKPSIPNARATLHGSSDTRVNSSRNEGWPESGKASALGWTIGERIVCAWPHRSGTEPRVDNACARARLRNPFDPARTSAVGAGSSGCSRTGITATWAPHRSMLRWPTRWRPRASARAGEDGDDAIDERVCLARVAANRDGGGDDAARGGARGSSAEASGLARGPRWAAEGDAGRCAGRSSRGSPRARPPRRFFLRSRRSASPPGDKARRADAPRHAAAVGSRAATVREACAEVRPVEGGSFGGVDVSCRTTAVASRMGASGVVVVGRGAPLRVPRDVFLGEGNAAGAPRPGRNRGGRAWRRARAARSDVHARDGSSMKTRARARPCRFGAGLLVARIWRGFRALPPRASLSRIRARVASRCA